MKESLYQLSYAGINAKPSGSAVVEGAGFEPAMHGSEPCALPLGDSSIWCPGRDLNPHAFRQLLLRQPCLPVPPPGHKKMWAWSRAAKPAPHCSSHLNRACCSYIHTNSLQSLKKWCPRRDLNPHVVSTPDPKTGASANSATRANI